MKWEELIENKEFLNTTGWVMTNIECPECGKQIYVNVERVLLSNPPKNEYKCLFCGWKGVG